MKLLVLILNKVEELEHLLEKFERNSIRGATILNSRGMAMALENYSKSTIDKVKIKTIKLTINLSKFLFTLPLLHC